MIKNKKPLIVIAGPTASGKTELSIQIAKKINGEIISGDSMQVYKKLNIGTAKITKAEMQNIPHHLIDIIEPTDNYNVCIFQEEAKKIINDIYARGKIPIVTGGTGLYIDSLVYDYSFVDEEKNTKTRDKLWDEYQKFGNEYLVEKLRLEDPEAITMIDISNTKRLIRALEINEKNNIKFSEREKDSRTVKESPYNLFYFVISMNRNDLYDKINQRVQLMFDNGWLDEVKKIINDNPTIIDYRSMQSIGYKQILQYLNNELTHEECLEKIKQNTRKFAKRQLTWFRKNKDVVLLDKSIKTSDEIFQEVINSFYKDLKMEDIICQKTQ